MLKKNGLKEIPEIPNRGTPKHGDWENQVILMNTMVTSELNQGIRRKMSITPQG